MVDLLPSNIDITSISPAAVASFSARIEQTITAWLDAAYNRTHSAETERAYRTTMSSFRAQLQQAGHDLADDPAPIALAAQRWASAGDVGPATHNRRLAILSSFYRYGHTSGLLPIENPISRVKRRPVQPYANVRALDREALRRGLRMIDRTSIEGMRDHALLSVGLVTCRRASELAGLRWRDVQLAGERVTLTWRHCKGGKIMHDTLPAALSRELLAYLQAAHGSQVGDLLPDAPIWVSTSRQNVGAAISAQAIGDICFKRLGTTKVHSLRHTGARAREDAGAKVSEIQAQLGHSNLATTSLYTTALKAADDPHGEAVMGLLGLSE